MLGDPKEILEKMNERAKRRSAVIWSGTSITGYIWDIIRNLIVIGIILAVYNVVYDPANTIIVSILILIYLSVVIIGAQLAQNLDRNNIRVYFHATEILKKLGQEEIDQNKEEFEKAGFLMEKVRYKFILNSVFNFIIFWIALYNLLGVL